MPTLADLYDADLRTRDPQIRKLAATSTIPHPLNNVQYADGISRCRHAKKHSRFELCNQAVRATPEKPAQTTKDAPA